MTDETHRPACRIRRCDRKSARAAALRRFVAACLVGLSATGACADDYPTRAVRMIVPQSPGSATDVLVRLIGPRMGQQLGQPIVVDNRAGAGGIVGADIAAKSAPDGYTLLVYGSTAAPQAALLIDDNSLPGSSGQARVRLVNAVADSTEAASLKLNFSSIASGVAQGSGSAYADQDAITAAEFDAAIGATQLAPVTDKDVVAQGVYTFFITGALNAPTQILYKDR